MHQGVRVLCKESHQCRLLWLRDHQRCFRHLLVIPKCTQNLTQSTLTSGILAFVLTKTT